MEKDKNLEACWQTLVPLVERAFRLSIQYEDFCRQDERLNKLYQTASPLAARSGREADRTVVRAIERLRSELRIGPRLLCREAPAAFRTVREFVPAEIAENIDALVAEIDDRFIRRTCQAILTTAGNSEPCDL